MPTFQDIKTVIEVMTSLWGRRTRQGIEDEFRKEGVKTDLESLRLWAVQNVGFSQVLQWDTCAVAKDTTPRCSECQERTPYDKQRCDWDGMGRCYECSDMHRQQMGLVLEGCPWCDAIPAIVPKDDPPFGEDSNHEWSAYCRNNDCGADASVSAGTPEQLTQKWNKRT